MTNSLAKIRILFRKDWKDTLKNNNAAVLLLLPLLFTLLYRFISFDGMPMPKEFISLIGVLMTLSLVPVALLSMMIAEEKEKNTLRTLMLSNVSAAVFLISKCLTALLLMTAVNGIIFILAGMALDLFPLYFITTTLAALCLMFLGALIGLLCKNQMSTGTLASPVALVMMVPPMLAQMNPFLEMIAKVLPTYAMMQILFTQEGAGLTPWIVLIAWLLLSFALFLAVYKKKRLDA